MVLVSIYLSVFLVNYCLLPMRIGGLIYDVASWLKKMYLDRGTYDIP